MRIVKTIEFTPTSFTEKKINKDDILSMIKEKYINTCSIDYGFIVDIKSLEKVIDSTISIYNGNIIIKCEIEITNLCPIVGQVLEGVIERVFNEGVILIVQNCLKVFIPFTLQQKNKYKPKSIIKFQIENIRFQKGKYDCIGKL